jgi:hypothetical protein
MKVPTLTLGTVVRDRYGHIGIVCTRETTPTESWIEKQLNSEEIKKLGKTDWWGVLVFGGGYLLGAGPLLTCLRDATYDDFVEAAEAAKATGRERLAKIFPAYLNRLLAERCSPSNVIS